MNEPSQLSPELRKISHAAAGWLTRRDRGFTPAEQDEFFTWLAADPRHGEWLARHQRTWKDFNLIAQWRPEHSAEPNPDLLLPRRSPRAKAGGVRLFAVILAAAAAVTAGLFFFRAPPAAEPVQSIASIYRSRVLEDGSTIGLRGDSEVLVRYTASERKVDLLRGEAFFTVAKNPGRPFVVHANGVDVRAVGTAFNVRLDPDRVEVLVTEGRVAVDSAKVGAVALNRPGSIGVEGDGRHLIAREIMVSVGERAVVPLLATAAAAVPEVRPVAEAEISRALAWQPGLLDFESAPLGDVVAEFNRRNRVQLVVADPGLREMPIVASFRSDNAEGFVRLLELTAGVRAERRGDVITLRPVLAEQKPH